LRTDAAVETAADGTIAVALLYPAVFDVKEPARKFEAGFFVPVRRLQAFRAPF
jgi:hypothetical protein